MVTRSRRFRAMLMAIGCAGAIAACNAIAGLGEDFALDPNAADGSLASMDEGGTLEGGGRDGSRTDGQLPDGGSDTSTTDGAAETFCATADSGDNAKGYCWDFEMAGGPPNYGWNAPRIEKDASLKVLLGSGIDGSHGLEVYVEQKVGSLSNVWLGKTLTSAAGDVHLELEYEFAVQASANIMYSAGVGMLAFYQTGTAPNEFGVSTYEYSVVASRLKTLDSTKAAPIAPDGSWHKARVVLDRGTTAALFSETASVDGTEVEALPKSVGLVRSSSLNAF